MGQIRFLLHCVRSAVKHMSESGASNDEQTNSADQRNK
jgi:hypothetical protein